MGHGIDIDWLIFVSDSPANVPHFQENLGGQLPLDGEVERIHYIGPEMHIQRLACGRRNVIYPWEGRLRKKGRSSRKRGNETVRPHAESIGNVNRSTARPVHIGLPALDRLDQTGTQ